MDRRHDVGLVALAMFGATAAVVGLPQRLIAFPVWLAVLLAALGAIGAVAVICAVEDDVTSVEAGIAAVIAIPVCAGIDWFSATHATRDPLLVGIATLLGAAAAAAIARRSQSPAWIYRVLFAALITAGVLATLALLGIVLHRAVGVKLDAVPWATSAGAGALLAWRAPQLTQVQVGFGLFLAIFGGGATLIPDANPEIPVGGVLFMIVIVSAIATGIGATAHHFMRRRLARREVATARVVQRSDET